MARTAYTLSDLLGLAARVFAPLLDPIRFELGLGRQPISATAAVPTPVAEAVAQAAASIPEPAPVLLTGAAADWEAVLADRQAECDRWAAEDAATDWDAEHRRMHAAEDAEDERRRAWEKERTATAETPAEIPGVPVEARSPVAPPEPCYVRRGAGKGTRYVMAATNEPGERFRRLVRSGRAKYEAVR